jgi:iron complex outermembrane receptor protein
MKTMTTVRLLTLAAFLVSAVGGPKPIFAADAELAYFGQVPTVYLASLMPESLEKASGIVSVITAQDIKEMGARSLNDVFDTIPGFETTANRRWFNGVQVRGLGNSDGSQIRFMIDGVAVNNVIGGTGFFSFTHIPLEDVERIEVIRGPGSALYGENALLGVVNIITKKAVDMPKAGLYAKAGSFHQTQSGILFGGVSGAFSIAGNMDYQDTRGYRKPVNRDVLYGSPYAFLEQTPADARNGGNHAHETLTLTYKDLTLGVHHHRTADESLVGVTSIVTTYDDVRNVHESDGWVGSVKFQAKAGDFKLEPSLQFVEENNVVAWQLYPHGFVIPFDLDGDGDIEYWPDGLKGSPSYLTRRYAADMKVEYAGLAKQSLISGLGYSVQQQPKILDGANFDPMTFAHLDQWTVFRGEKAWNIERGRVTASGYLQDKMSLRDNLALSVGGRYDHYSDLAGSFNPRGALVWSVNDKSDVKLLYGTAYRVPDFLSLYNKNNPAEVGNPNLKPETIKTYEAAYYYKPDANGSLFGVNGFYNDVNNLIQLRSVGAGPQQWTNTERQQVYGVETEYKVLLTRVLKAGLNYSYTAGRDVDGHALPYISRHKGGASLNVKPASFLNWNLSGFFQSRKDRAAGDLRAPVKAQGIVNTTLLATLGSHVEMSFSVHNLFDHAYVSPDTTGEIYDDFPREGRSVQAGVTWKF